MPGDGPPILVTGITRSGTTWVASMLNASSEVVYVNEPLNPQHPPGRSPGVLRADVRHRFQYICADNEAEFEDAYRDLVNLRYHLAAELRTNHRIADVGRALRHLGMFTRGRIQDRRLMVADPFAVFSAEWFARQMGFRVVVIVRHPLAVVSSRKRLGWKFDLDELLAQPLLLRDWLNPIETSWPEALRHTDDVVAGGAQLWRLVYEVVSAQHQRLPDMIVVRHEDLSLDPVGEFRALYDVLGLTFDERAEQTIVRSSSSQNPGQLDPSNPHAVQLDSRANLESWRSRISADDAGRILQIAGPLTDRLYPAWSLGQALPLDAP